MFWYVDGELVIFWLEIVDWSNFVCVCGGNLLLFLFFGCYCVDGEFGCWCDVVGVVCDLLMYGFVCDLLFDV